MIYEVKLERNFGFKRFERRTINAGPLPGAACSDWETYSPAPGETPVGNGGARLDLLQEPATPRRPTPPSPAA